LTGTELEAGCLAVLGEALLDLGYDSRLSVDPEWTDDPLIWLGMVGHHSASKDEVLAIYARAIELLDEPIAV
jgi:hypothetical protein